MKSETCCTCASLLSELPPAGYNEKTEKPNYDDSLLECCGRVVCGNCMAKNPRFGTYCPYCQHTGHDAAETSPSPRQGPSTPPREVPESENYEKEKESAPDVLHFVHPEHDTISSLSLRYGVPAGVLRKTNGIFADHLLAARRTILIPGEYYKGGVSLSPRPVEGEEEEIRRSKIRRWQVACKVPEYDIAVLYLEQSGYNLDAAVEAYRADEAWEKENPLSKSTGKRKVYKKPLRSLIDQ